MHQVVKFLPGVGALLCVVLALLMQFMWHETSWAFTLALFALLLSQIPAPGTAARKREAQKAAQNREARKVRAQRRRLLADVQAHQRNVARGEGPAASS